MSTTAYFLDANFFEDVLYGASRGASLRRLLDVVDAFERLKRAGDKVYLPHVVRHEVERHTEINRLSGRDVGMTRRFRQFVQAVGVRSMSISDRAMNAATDVWVKAMLTHKIAPSEWKNRRTFDGDMVIIAEVRVFPIRERKVMVTNNRRHFSPYLPCVSLDDFRMLRWGQS